MISQTVFTPIESHEWPEERGRRESLQRFNDMSQIIPAASASVLTRRGFLSTSSTALG
ncbi:MAG: hypothetical protein RJB04_2349, partial [Verrucomicrobiota bacterium]